LAGVFSAVSGVLGTYISFVLPQMPTGPWVVVFLSLVALISFLFAPKRGVISRYFSRRSYLKRTHQDHLLKALYRAGEKDQTNLSIEEIYETYPFQKKKSNQSIKYLIKEGLIIQNQLLITLTSKGKSESKRIVRLHRLWELYLNEYMNIAPDHVHDSAEKLEHILTPELEQLLESRLNYPKLDPHQETIPRDNDEL
jgi:manganese/zinc/iron transport system permease protein